jgi:hypothetical protein
MAYTINKTDGTVITTVEDGTLNNDTSVSLVGQNYQGYGEAIGENFITLLENSANTSAPTKPITGELWYDKGNNALKIYDGSFFQHINSVRPSASAPTQSLRTGVLWYDTTNSLLKIHNGTTFITVGPTTVLDEDDMASNSATAVPSQQSVKAFVDAQIVASNTLPVTDDTSTTISVPFTKGLNILGGTNITTSVNVDSTAGVESEYEITINLDSDNLSVNNLSSADSTAIQINDGINVSGAATISGAATLNTSLALASGATVTAILDEDNFSSNSATALATQQSIKAYVDNNAGGTLQIGDTASNNGSVSLTNDEELIFRSGDSLTTTVAGNGVTFDLNETISVDQINAGDSTAITIGAPVLLASDSGMTIGADNDVTLTQSGANFTLKNTTEDGNILFNVNDGGSDATVITITGADKSVTMAGNLSITGNLTVSGSTTTVSSTTTTIVDPLIVLNKGASIISGYDAGFIIDRGIGDSTNQKNTAFVWDESANEFALIFTQEDGTTAGNVDISQYANLQVSNLTGVSSEATYADLAERYEADGQMDIGDVVKLGGEKEITKTTEEYDTDVFGVIAENPAFKMNASAGDDASHPYVTLTGRTVCKVQGPITKGDRLVASDVPGVAKKCDINHEKFHTLSIVGRSLGSHATTDVAMIEVVLGRN